jgi:RecJ-like exonuclease
MTNYTNFKEITKNDVGTKHRMRGRVEVIKQTSGPTLMILNDGTGSFTFKAFVKPGVRAYPEINIGDYVTLEAQINERQGSIEGEISFMEKLQQEDKHSFQEKLKTIEEEQFKPNINSFSIESKVLEALKPRFIAVATLIRKAIIERRPIILRHDADCDGYSSAICMERAIIEFMKETFPEDKMLPYQNYRRAPSKAPFYEYEDAVKDMAYWLRDKVKNDAKSPLIIITDNGSTSEDIMGYKQVKLYDCEIVVIDHHYPGELDENGECAVDAYVSGHINPYLEGFDSNVCSGMLGYELARFIYEKNSNSVMIPAMAGLLDHVDGPEKDTYVSLAESKGFTREYMEKLGEIIYLQSHYLRFQESREFVDDLFGANPKVQQEIVNMLYPEIEKRYKRVRKIADHYSEVEDYGAFYVVHFDGEKGTARGQFPAVGKSTNEIHDHFEQKLDKPVITMTSGSTFLTIRVGDAIKGFSVPEFCTEIDSDIPWTAAEGGGHEHAGSVKFVEYGREEVISAFKRYLKKIAEHQ